MSRPCRFSRRSVSITFIAVAAVAMTAPRASAIIINGLPADAATAASSWDGVGKITIQNITDGSTGTLLDSIHVLTAAHAVFNSSTNSAFNPLTTAVTFTVNGTPYSVKSIALAPGYVDNGTQSDLAVLTLASPANGVATWTYNTGALSESGKNTTIVGYGYSGDGTSGANSTTFPFGTKRAADNVIDLVTGSTQSATITDSTPSAHQFNVPANMIAYDFDKVGGDGTPLSGTALGSSEGTIADGDSGAPMFQFNSTLGKYVITGVAVDSSDPTDRFGEVGWGTRVSSYASFVTASVPEPTALALVALAPTVVLRRRVRRA